jgi:hypothetical protein
VGQEVRDVCRDAGFDGFLAKPADRDAIAAEMHRLAGPGIRKPAAGSGLLSAAAPPLPSDFALLPPSAAGKVAAGAVEAGPLGGGEFVGGLDFDTPCPF